MAYSCINSNLHDRRLQTFFTAKCTKLHIPVHFAQSDNKPNHLKAIANAAGELA